MIYTESDDGREIKYRSSDTDSISFGPKKKLLSAAVLNNPSSTKQNFIKELVVTASTKGGRQVRGVLFASY